jgi:hypothetical protein
MNFSADIKKAAKAMGKDADEVLAANVLKMAGKIIKATPALTGTARNNWFFSIDTEASGERDGKKPAPDAHANAVDTATKFSFGHVFYIINRVPYVRHLENGTPKMKPFGMIKSALDDLQESLKKYR